MNEKPCNVPLEEIIIACLILDADALGDMPSENDFSTITNRAIFNIIQDMVNKGDIIDIIRVSARMKSPNALAELSRMTDAVATTATYPVSIIELRAITARRQLWSYGNNLVKWANESNVFDNATDIKNYAMREMDDAITVKTRTTQDDSFRSIMADIIKDVNDTDRKPPCVYGLTELNRLTGGLRPGDLTIIAGLTGSGKTAAMIHLSVANATCGKKVVVITREMPKLQQGKRILSNLTGINGYKLKSPGLLTEADKTKIESNRELIDALPIEINDRISTIQELRSFMRSIMTRRPIDLLCIDYLGLMQTMKKCDSKRLEIEDISRQCKEISMEFNIPVVALSQLNRGAAVVGGDPQLHNLRESGSIEQDADNVIFISVTKDADRNAEHYTVKFILAKQRTGSVGSIYANFHPGTMTFTDFVGDRYKGADADCPF